MLSIEIKSKPQDNISKKKLAIPVCYNQRKVAHSRVQWIATAWEELFKLLLLYLPLKTVISDRKSTSSAI